MQVLAAFPHTSLDLATPASLSERGLAWRRAHADDLPFLRELYATTRADELASVPWPDVLKRRFIDDQFALQHAHFVGHYDAADFLVIVHDGEPIGRLYVMRDPSREYAIVDIALLPAWRSQGVGSLLITQIQHEASEVGRGVQLQVSIHNPVARRLYERLGFVTESPQGDEGSHRRMRWRGHAFS